MTVPFSDRDHAPRPEAFIEAVGPEAARWRALTGWLADRYGLAGEPYWDGAATGWCLRYRRGGRSLLTLIPRDDAFRALVVVGPSAWAAAAGADLGQVVRSAWDGARPYPDGRWLWLDVADDETVAGIEALVALKSPPPRHPRRSAAVAA